MKSRKLELTESERIMLKKIWNTDASSQARKRAHAILLSDSGKNMARISEIFFVQSETVSKWLTRWEKKGVEGLYDEAGRGRAPIFNPLEEKK